MNLLKKTSVYFTSNILNAIIPFILLPVLTRYLSPAEYGQIAMFQTLLAALSSFIGFNAIAAAGRKFYDGEIDNEILRLFNGSSIQVIAISSAATYLVVYIFEQQLSEFLGIPSLWILASVLISSLSCIVSLRLGQWQIRGEARWYGVLQVFIGLLNMLLSLLLVIELNKGAEGRIAALVVSTIITAIISLFFLYKDKLLKIRNWNYIYIKEILNFGVPLIPHTVGFFLISSVDRFVINERMGLTEAGIYMVAVQLSSAMGIVFDAINKAYVPWLFEKLKVNNTDEKFKIVKSTYIYFIVVLTVAIISFSIGPLFIRVVAGDNYEKAGDIIGLLCLGQAFGGMYLMVTNYIFYTKKTGNLALVTIITGLINLLLLIVLINSMGLIGAALAYCISRFIQFLLTWFISSKVIYMPWSLSRT